MSVSVITRTIGTEIFLRRALGSLSAAAPSGTEWIVVDDGAPEPGLIDAIIANAKADGHLRPILVQRRSRHRAKAMNAGLEAATGDAIHILDDDDTIHPAFYDEALTALGRSPHHHAVAVRCEKVEERIGNDHVIREIRRTPHFPEISALGIATMLVQQVTPPCSLLFRREAMRGVGPFAEHLAVCEDYEFLLRFLLRHDIVLIDKQLASFHTRTPDSCDRYGNSDSSRRHADVDAAFRNYMLRRSLQNRDDPLGLLLLIGDLARGATKIDRATSLLRGNATASRFYRWLRHRRALR